MADGFGARLRQLREERQIDLVAIAQQTKIKLSLLEALERDDVSRWPTGIFRRAYIRAYAQFIGLDPDVVVREFLEAYPDPGDELDVLAALSTVSEDDAKRNAPPPTRLRTIVDSALESLARRRRQTQPGTPEVSARGTRAGGPAGPVRERQPIEAGTLTHAAPKEADETHHLLSGLEAAPPENAHSPDAGNEQRAGQHSVPEPGSSREGIGGVERAEPARENIIAAQEVTEGDDRAVPKIDGDVSAARERQRELESTLEVLARLCTDLGTASNRHELTVLLQESARVLDAGGLIVWLWDSKVEALRAVLSHGYSEQVLRQLPLVPIDSDNATAAAFRSAETCTMKASPRSNAAVVVPLLLAEGCTGVLAIELREGIEPTVARRAIAEILASALTQLVYRARLVERGAPDGWGAFPLEQPRSPNRPARVRR